MAWRTARNPLFRAIEGGESPQRASRDPASPERQTIHVDEGQGNGIPPSPPRAYFTVECFAHYSQHARGLRISNLPRRGAYSLNRGEIAG